jgi:hypothetical protein
MIKYHLSTLVAAKFSYSLSHCIIHNKGQIFPTKIDFDQTVVFLQLSDSILNTAVKHRCSVEGIPCELDIELLKNVRATIKPEPRTFLNVPVFHPEENYSVLVVCLIDYDKKGMTESACTNLVTELFR